MDEVYIPDLNITLYVGDHVDLYYPGTNYGKNITIKAILKCSTSCSKEHCKTRVMLEDKSGAVHPCLNTNLYKIVKLSGYKINKITEVV